MFVIYVQTGREDEVLRSLRQLGYTAYVPKRILKQRKKGIYYQIQQILFTSYVFLDSGEIIAEDYYKIRLVNGVGNFLNRTIPISEAEEEYIRDLCECEESGIQLFNAKTGKLEHKQENTNIVTNAVQDILTYNDPLGWGARLRQPNSSDYVRMGVQQFNYLHPFPTTAFGGLLLFDSNIDEDPTIMMPPDGVMETAHAGSAYSGVNPHRGSYNTNESGAIDEEDRKGYRHVWDFGTDKGNGTIKCLSLTSRTGGDIGYINNFPNNSDYLNYANPYDYCVDYNGDHIAYTNNYFGITLPSALNSYNDIFIRAKDDGKSAILTTHYNGSTYDIVEVTINKPSQLTLSSGLRLPATSKVLIENILCQSGAWIYYYNNEIHSSRVSNGKILSVAYSLDGVQTKNVTITLPRTP